MTGDCGTRWSNDIPDDLLAAIYRRCSTTYDRARFSAVCRLWRAAASWQPKLPGLPLLLNSTGNGALDRNARAYCPEEGRVLRAQLPWLPYGKRIVGCHDGGWVAAMIGWRIDVVNLFTCNPLLRKGDIDIRDTSIRKIVFSKDPSSSAEGCILAALDTVKRVKLYKIGSPVLWWTTKGRGLQRSVPEKIADIAFSNGYLYCLTDEGDLLYKLVIDPNKVNPMVVISLEKLIIQTPTMKFDPQYIFELPGKLATAVEVTPVSNNEASSFRVFELATTSESSKYTWEEVMSLGDHALFLGPGCCKAVHVSAAGMCGELEGNRIYYTKHFRKAVDSKCLDRLDLRSCSVYCFESDGVDDPERIMSRGFHYQEKEDGINGRNSCTWILPPNF